MRYIEDLKEGEVIVSHYLCRSKETKQTKSGKNYFSLTLTDRTGSVSGKVWNLNNDIKSFEAGDFIKVEARAEFYLEELQLNIGKIRKSTEGEYLPSDYIPTTEKDVDEIYKTINGLIKSFQNEHLQKLLESIFIKDEDIKKAFLSSSSARSMHHSYMGGLAEHTLNVAQICDFLGARFKYVNRDILIAAALLHDIGKIYELSPFPENDYTDRGKLLGHITIGTQMVMAKISGIPNFPQVLSDLLIHCLLSHHGKLEFGSPILPKTMEAFILTHADTMDAHTKMFEEYLDKLPQNSDWGSYHRTFGREIRKSSF